MEMNGRHEHILRILSDELEVSVSELSRRLQVSMVTVRSDLRQLEMQGLLNRSHGGASIPDSDDINRRMSLYFTQKQRIARAAVEEIGDNETVLLEAGSSIALMAQYLEAKRNINVITNNAFVARQMKDAKNVEVILLGGVFQKESETMVGSMVTKFLSLFNFSKVFLGMDGFVMGQGPMCRDIQRTDIMAEFAAKGKKVYFLSDSSKMGREAVRTICRPEDIDCLITDDGISEEYMEYFRDIGVELKIV